MTKPTIDQLFVAEQAKAYRAKAAHRDYLSWVDMQRSEYELDQILQTPDVEEPSLSARAYVAWLQKEIASLASTDDINVGLYCRQLVDFQVVHHATTGESLVIS